MATKIQQVVGKKSSTPTNRQPWKFKDCLNSILIPRTLIQDRKLLAGASFLWGAIRQHLQTDGRCYASDKTLAAEIGVGWHQLVRYSRQLEQWGYLRHTPRPGKTSVRELLWHPRFGATWRGDVSYKAGVSCLPGQGVLPSEAGVYKEDGVLSGVLTSRKPVARETRDETPELPGVTLSPAEWEIEQYRCKARAAGVPPEAIEKHAERMRLKFATAEARRIKEGKELAARIAKAIQP